MSSGNLPSDWRVMTLGDCLAEPLVNGRSHRTADIGFPVLRVNAIRSGSVLLQERKTAAWSARDAQPFLVKQGDFFVVRGNGSLGLVGRGGLVSIVPDAVGFPDKFIRVRPRVDIIYREFLSLVWDSEGVRGQLETAARSTSGLYMISQSAVSDVRIPVPPLETQRDIVVALGSHFSSLDAAVRGLVRARANARRLYASVLGTAIREAGGARRPLSEVILSMRNGIAAKPDGSSGQRILRISAVRPMKVDLDAVRYLSADPSQFKEYILMDGDLLFTRYNGNPQLVGSCAMVVGLAEETVYPDKLIRVRVDQAVVRPAFLQFAVCTGATRDEVQRMVKTTAGQAGISGGDLKRVAVRVPSLAVQDDVVERIGHVATFVQRLDQALAVQQRRAELFKKALLRDAVDGRLSSSRAPSEASCDPVLVA